MTQHILNLSNYHGLYHITINFKPYTEISLKLSKSFLQLTIRPQIYTNTLPTCNNYIISIKNIEAPTKKWRTKQLNIYKSIDYTNDINDFFCFFTL